ncbi:MAG: hypothetical protein M3O67_04870 [Bacteroidota bacterium]|nr:hypothetical protein [Bacteroidota bacterium]
MNKTILSLAIICLAIYTTHAQVNGNKTYEAYETGKVDSYCDSKLIKKDTLTDNTFYYEGTYVSVCDKIINPGVPYTGVQFVLNYKIKYYIKRNK